jgi:molybdopterin-guanine dinucleotide biosynthesis protein A
VSPAAPSQNRITLGLLAGGRGSRLGGVDKAWLERDGVPQVLRLARRFDREVAAVLISANDGVERYREHGLTPVTDRVDNAGPLAGIAALAEASSTPWLLTLPVDVVAVNDCLLPSLAAAGGTGAVAEDDDGLQPLVALWRRDVLLAGARAALMEREFAVQALQRRLGMVRVRLAGVRFGNLNTPDDLAAAGVRLPPVDCP